jgi:predicted AAA+ superfamily ATPase
VKVGEIKYFHKEARLRFKLKKYIHRELEHHIIEYFSNSEPRGLILTGIVGCGKTTLIKYIREQMKSEFDVFSFTGDDALFRQKIIEDTYYLLNSIKAKTNKRALIFIDEVQKIDEAFDAVKIAFDEGLCSFIVSGSNPAYLSTVAKKRLQRRADQIFMLPLSLNELIIDQKLAPPDSMHLFRNILWEAETLNKLRIPEIGWTEKIPKLLSEFSIYGGLPLAVAANSNLEKLREIRMTVERGFDLISSDNNSTADIVRRELALLHSREFTYKNILEKTRLRQRDQINDSIDKLINHGYLVKRKLYYFEQQKSSYLTIFSYVDPGIVTYLSGEYSYEASKGFQTEGYIHSRLAYLIRNDPRIADLQFYKEYELDSRGNLRYLKSDVDFVFTQGKRVIPIECKAGLEVKAIELEPIKKFISKANSPFGIVLYAGVPQINKKDKILFWPYWLV